MWWMRVCCAGEGKRERPVRRQGASPGRRFLFARAFQIMVEQGSGRVLAILSAATAIMAAGEVLH